MGDLNLIHGTPDHAEIVVESGGKVTLKAGAVLQVQGKLAPASASFTPAAGGANVSLVSIQVKDAAGVALTRSVMLEVWLSDAATGIGLTATTASGAVGAGASGTDLIAQVAKKLTLVQTNAAGLYILSITDAAKTGFFVCAQVVGEGSGPAFQVSAQLVTGNYG